MFIEKDLRKVQEILEDPEDEREKLKLGRREAQFNGTISVLSDLKFRDSLSSCEYLSLYNNRLHTIRGIDAFEHSPLQQLNLGRNLLKTLPSGLAKVSHTLSSLWVEDNHIQGFPKVILSLKHLRILRMCNNPGLGGIPDGIRVLKHLEEASFEGCGISSIPDGLLTLSRLRLLMLRRNRISEFPEAIGGMTALERVHLNDNKLRKLPASIGDLHRLRVLLLNTNELEALPASMGNLKSLETLTLSHNKITSVPPRLLALWRPSLPDGLREAAEAVTLALSQSPPVSPGRVGTDSGSGGIIEAASSSRASGGGEVPAGTPAKSAGLAGLLSGVGSGRLDCGSGGSGRSPASGAGADDSASLEEETLTFDLDFTGNPVWKDPGSLFTLSQYTTPLAMEWSRKRAEAEEAAKEKASKKARIGI